MTPLALVTDFKAQFNREFQYGVNANQVQDADIQRALNESVSFFNPDLWQDSIETVIAYCYCAAHLMVLNIREAGGLSVSNNSLGLTSTGDAYGVISSQSSGPASASFVLPASVTEDRILSQFMATGFGRRYLFMLTPRIPGAMFVAQGWTEDAGFADSPPTGQDMLPTGNFNVSADQDTLAYGLVVLHYFFYVMDTNEQNARIVIPRGGTLEGLMVRVGANTLNGPTIVTVLKNGVAQNLSCTFAAGILAGQDSQHSVVITAADEISIQIDIRGATTGGLTAVRATLALQL